MFRLYRLAAASAAVALSLGCGAAIAAGAQHTVMVGGAAMYPNRTIVQNAVHSKDHTTLVAAVKAAGLVDTLNSAGPFTVFAPTNAAFAALPEGAVASLLQPENKATLTKVLTYHMVAGRLSAEDLIARAQAGGGRAELTTVEGGKLIISGDSAGWWVTDEKGGRARITQTDVYQSNGVIHVVDAVLSPN